MIRRELALLSTAIEHVEQRAPEGLCIVRVPVPAAPSAERLLARFPALDATYWAEPWGFEHIGLEPIEVLSGSGAERFSVVKEQSNALFARLHGDTASLRLFGGFAFQSGRVSSPVWQPFGEARFTLPRITYQRSGDQAELLVAVRTASVEDRERALSLATAALSALVADAPAPEAPSGTPELVERPDSEHLALVRASCRAIDRGELEKVVLSRSVRVLLSRPFDAARVLRRLSAIAPECVRFAFRSQGTTFVGATPERLVLKRGSNFETEAVAGSSRVGEAAHHLIESAKDRAEHAIVVREVLRALTPVADRIDHATVPELHQLKHVAHLRTPIRGTLQRTEHVLELVERLHPTPAVGGVPRVRALSFIAENEPDERGWYAGPIGWFDAKGDGEFAVALRSGVFSENRGALYAGGGIVRGSDPESELAETRWKLAALSAALE